MDKNTERREEIEHRLKRINIYNYSRIVGVDGFNMNANDKCVQLLQPIGKLVGQEFDYSGYKFLYDGSIEKSFPYLYVNGHHGTKGLTMSNLIAFNESLQIDKDWICILEDDAEIDENSLNTILNFINDAASNQYEIILLDNRSNGWGGTAGMLYKKSSIPKIMTDLHPLSDFSINNQNTIANLWDWKIWRYINEQKISFTNLPCINSGRFDSTINI